MNAATVKAKLVEVLQSIQSASGENCPAIVGGTKPLEELPNFDSKIWPVAIGMLASGLGIKIPDDKNIFKKDKTCDALTIDQSVAIVLALAQEQPSPNEQAAAS